MRFKYCLKCRHKFHTLKRLSHLILFILCIFITYHVWNNLMIFWYTKKFNDFSYPIDIDLYHLIEAHESKKDDKIKPFKQINPLPFEPLLGTKSDGLNEEIDILYLIKTQHSNYDNRREIRRTWGNPQCGTNYGMKTTTKFLFGRLDPSLNNAIQMETNLDKENLKYKDIVQYSFIDNYYNNTYKLMCALKYASDFYPKAKYIIIQDDDYFVHPPNLFSHLKNIHPRRYPYYVGGGVWYKARPNRDSSNKWSISFEDYPFEYFPDYPAGGSVIISMPLARHLSIAFRYLKFMAFDDVLIGIALLKLGIAPHNVNGMCKLKDQCSVQYVERVISSHGYRDPRELLEIWDFYQLKNACRLKHHHPL